MKNNKLRLALLLATALVTNSISAQNMTIKTNALYWSTVTPNLAIETKMGEKMDCRTIGRLEPFYVLEQQETKAYRNTTGSTLLAVLSLRRTLLRSTRHLLTL